MAAAKAAASSSGTRRAAAPTNSRCGGMSEATTGTPDATASIGVETESLEPAGADRDRGLVVGPVDGRIVGRGLDRAAHAEALGQRFQRGPLRAAADETHLYRSAQRGGRVQHRRLILVRPEAGDREQHRRFSPWRSRRGKKRRES